jgi:UDP-N-acetyl-D-glucosamine dehydrogenase
VQRDVAVVGAGYVGLPLAVRLAEAGRTVVCLDPAADKMERLNAGDSYIEDVASADLKRLVDTGMLAGTTDEGELRDADAILICVPTPLAEHREPDLGAVRSATAAVARNLRKGHVVVLESTTYPGTTREVLQPMLEEGGLTAGVDFHLAMSPERIDPGRTDFTVHTTPKVMGGLTPACAERAAAVYQGAVDTIIQVSSPEAAELAKLLENIFRTVNIALVNELAMLCDRMGLDVWEVVDAAATKPFGFMRFEPGPGLGGHCLPIDPFYLTWKAREHEFSTEFIELAGKVNGNMPSYCVDRIARVLNDDAKSVRGADVLVLGVAYKNDVGDMRESPALPIIELLRERGAHLRYHDPHVAAMPELDLQSVALTPEAVAAADCVVIITGHNDVDYAMVVDRAASVLDLRNATGRRSLGGANVQRL